MLSLRTYILPEQTEESDFEECDNAESDDEQCVGARRQPLTNRRLAARMIMPVGAHAVRVPEGRKEVTIEI